MQHKKAHVKPIALSKKTFSELHLTRCYISIKRRPCTLWHTATGTTGNSWLDIHNNAVNDWLLGNITKECISIDFRCRCLLFPFLHNRHISIAENKLSTPTNINRLFITIVVMKIVPWRPTGGNLNTPPPPHYHSWWYAISYIRHVMSSYSNQYTLL